MSSSENLFDDETLHLSPFCSIGSPDPRISGSPDPCNPESPDPYILLMDFLENESIELISDSMNESNPLMSSQQSNLVEDQGISTLLQDPLEMQQQPQQQHQVLQQQPLENSSNLWLQNNLRDDFSSISLLNNFQESSVFAKNQIEIGQVAQENNGFAHPTMTSSPILPAPLLHGDHFDAFGSYSQSQSLGSQNYPSYQTPRPVTSSANMYGQQPPQMNFTGRQNEPNNSRMVNNSAMTYPFQNQPNIMPTFNLAPQSNIPYIPRPQVSSSFPRHLDGMQRSVNQSSSRLRFSDLNTPMQIHPYANSFIPPQDEVVGSKRRGYENRFELGQSSSSAQRQRVVPGGQNITPAAVNLDEPRQTNNIYSPIYESLGLYVDPHLRNYFFMRTD
ncbi:PREDICTED: uncharacterized protein LOC104753902 [Camelina sativa]|uniref:Uncharacterized protein LOC104753902 n=1 Tax=Camelina sativa TaxID=90675 RepID=A0ABM1R2X9_CAMSA|nr:PREDICTED: uncharacterized protein LOC104753902 [Camelina sativa]